MWFLQPTPWNIKKIKQFFSQRKSTTDWLLRNWKILTLAEISPPRIKENHEPSLVKISLRSRRFSLQTKFRSQISSDFSAANQKKKNEERLGDSLLCLFHFQTVKKILVPQIETSREAANKFNKKKEFKNRKPENLCNYGKSRSYLLTISAGSDSDSLSEIQNSKKEKEKRREEIIMKGFYQLRNPNSQGNGNLKRCERGIESYQTTSEAGVSTVRVQTASWIPRQVRASLIEREGDEEEVWVRLLVSVSDESMDYSRKPWTKENDFGDFFYYCLLFSFSFLFLRVLKSIWEGGQSGPKVKRLKILSPAENAGEERVWNGGNLVQLAPVCK